MIIVIAVTPIPVPTTVVVPVPKPVVGVEVAEAQVGAHAPVGIPPAVSPIAWIREAPRHVTVRQTDEVATVIVIVIAIAAGIACIVGAVAAGKDVPIVVAVVPAGIVISGFVPRVHARVGQPHSKTHSEREGEAAPGILCSHRFRTPSEGATEYQRRSDQPTHDMPPWKVFLKSSARPVPRKKRPETSLSKPMGTISATSMGP